MNLNDLETFVVVAEEGTFSAAADRLDVPPSTISRRVSRLEEDLGVALFHRSARSIALSDDGRALAARCSPAIRELHRAERELGDSADTPRGLLRVTTSIDFGASAFFTHLVADYASSFEEVEVEVEVTNRVVDLLEEGFDVGCRIHPAALADREDLVQRRLAQTSIHVYTSPYYLEDCGPVESLEGHRVLAHTRTREAGTASVLANDFGPLAPMIAAGAGVGALPLFVAAPYVQRGELVRLDHLAATSEVNVSLVWLRSRHLAPRVRAFIDLAVAHAAETDWSS